MTLHVHVIIIVLCVVSASVLTEAQPAQDTIKPHYNTHIHSHKHTHTCVHTHTKYLKNVAHAQNSYHL